MSQPVAASQQIVWDQAVLDKYNYAGPRYTSYPTALELHEAFTIADYDMACTEYPERPLSLYIHIPFCHKLCYYCGCNKVITRHVHKADQYLDVLEDMLEFYGRFDFILRQGVKHESVVGIGAVAQGEFEGCGGRVGHGGSIL